MSKYGDGICLENFLIYEKLNSTKKNRTHYIEKVKVIKKCKHFGNNIILSKNYTQIYTWFRLIGLKRYYNRYFSWPLQPLRISIFINVSTCYCKRYSKRGFTKSEFHSNAKTFVCIWRYDLLDTRNPSKFIRALQINPCRYFYSFRNAKRTPPNSAFHLFTTF